MRSLAFVLLLSSVVLAQVPTPLQPRIDFDAVLSKELDALGDTKKLTDLQKDAAWDAIEKKVLPYWQGKTWLVDAEVENIDDDEDGKYVLKLKPNVSQKNDKCKWVLNSTQIKLAMTKKEAANIHKGDFITFTGVALHIPDNAHETKKLEFARKVARSLAIPLHIRYKTANIDVTLTDVKYSRPALPK
jgi:hypothetical protein